MLDRQTLEWLGQAFGYPVVPALYLLGAATITLVLLLYRTQTSWPGLVIVLTGFPVYFLWRRGAKPGTAD